MAKALVDHDELYCSECGAEVESIQCDCCDGDGIVWHNADSEEPWNRYETCEECEGNGHWIRCDTHGELDSR